MEIERDKFDAMIRRIVWDNIMAKLSPDFERLGLDKSDHLYMNDQLSL